MESPSSGRGGRAGRAGRGAGLIFHQATEAGLKYRYIDTPLVIPGWRSREGSDALDALAGRPGQREHSRRRRRDDSGRGRRGKGEGGVHAEGAEYTRIPAARWKDLAFDMDRR